MKAAAEVGRVVTHQTRSRLSTGQLPLFDIGWRSQRDRVLSQPQQRSDVDVLPATRRGRTESWFGVPACTPRVLQVFRSCSDHVGLDKLTGNALLSHRVKQSVSLAGSDPGLWNDRCCPHNVRAAEIPQIYLLRTTDATFMPIIHNAPR